MFGKNPQPMKMHMPAQSGKSRDQAAAINYAVKQKQAAGGMPDPNVKSPLFAALTAPPKRAA